jgi:hypothetical protein
MSRPIDPALRAFARAVPPSASLDSLRPPPARARVQDAPVHLAITTTHVPRAVGERSEHPGVTSGADIAGMVGPAGVTALGERNDSAAER